jgi:D-cysteine desulfhydrase/L-cysteate sulfo-lyase
VLSGPPVEPPGPNQRLDELLGATVHIAATDERSDRAALAASVVAELRAAGQRPYLVGVGGSGVVGAVGQVLAGQELAEQAAALGIAPVTLVLPTATGGTHAGLLAGLAVAGLPTRVVGVTVAAPGAELRPVIESLLGGLGVLAGRTIDAAPIELDDSERGEGYGRPTAAADEATRLLARTEGILVDPIYTAKALARVVRGARVGDLAGPVIFWHAGGTPGIFEPLD